MAIGLPAAAGAAAYGAALGLQAAGDVAYLLGGAFLLKTTFSVRMLGRATLGVGRRLDAGQLQEARHGLLALVSRDTSGLPAPLLASAAVESVAENTTDSVVAPWLAFALFGLPGAFAYRAINTLDAMIGYHGAYEFLGKAAARLDDVVNLVPARATGLIIVVASLLAGAQGRAAWRTLWRDHAKTESPNAGWPMAAMAGALRTRLQKVGHYTLGHEYPDPGPQLVPWAVRITSRAAALALIFAGAITVLRHAFV